MKLALVLLALLAPSAAALVPQPLAGLVAIPPAQGTALMPLPLGTFELNGRADSACPAEHHCEGFTVACPGVEQDINGYLAIAEPTGPARGVAVFHSGGGGGGYELSQLPDASFPTQLRADGFRLVQVRWSGQGWLAAAPEERAGFAKLACRPATSLQWIHENLYLPLSLDPAAGVCGYCVTGNSGGSTQVGFALSHYGLDVILDAVIPTGGPPHASLDKACNPLPTEPGRLYPDGTRAFIDTGWGFYDQQGPCLRRSAGWLLRFMEDSVAGLGSDYTHETTRVRLLVGANDQGMVPNAEDYLERLQDAGTEWASFAQVPGTPHFVLATAQGRAEVRAALLAEP